MNKNAWYIACPSRTLGDKPVATCVAGVRMVLFRAADQPVALLDRCAHRNAPLSCGRVVNEHIECAYHGWRYAPDGVCDRVPSLLEQEHTKARRVPSFPVCEQQGYVWVCAEEAQPRCAPFVFPYLNDSAYAIRRYSMIFLGSLFATAENILDVPHTAFLHRGLFRGVKSPQSVHVHIQRGREHVQASYEGEQRPAGLLGRLLAPQGGEIQHVDRFMLPCMAQVEYRLGYSHLVISTALTPRGEFETEGYTMVALRIPHFAALIAHLAMPFAKKVATQDARMLRLQSEVIRRSGGEQFAYTKSDVLGPHMLRLLKDGSAEDFEEHVQMMV
jgi:phenylpropionate dioxygenase-like ring-hydroxylating dioxygenase large terminal subunit